MTSVVLLTARWCSHCPSARSFWRELENSSEFDYEEVDAESKKGMQLIEQYSIASVPTSIINGRVLFHGVPLREEVERFLEPLRRMPEPRE